LGVLVVVEQVQVRSHGTLIIVEVHFEEWMALEEITKGARQGRR